MQGEAFDNGYASMHDTGSMLAWCSEPFLATRSNYWITALNIFEKRSNCREGSSNHGLSDRILLLDSVQNNVEAFDEGPRDVAITGFDAGAQAVPS